LPIKAAFNAYETSACLLCFLLKGGGNNAGLFITLPIMLLPVFQ